MRTPAAPTLRQRALAILALGAGIAALLVQLHIATRSFPLGLIAAALGLTGIWAAWRAIVRRGPARLAAAAFAVAALGASIVLLLTERLVLELAGSAALLGVALAAAHRALGVDVRALNGISPPGDPAPRR